MKKSTLKFRDFVLEYATYTKIIWNGQLIYDDDFATRETIEEIDRVYGDKLVYEMFVKVVYWHHCELSIKGEE